MNRNELIATMAEKSGLTKKDTDAALTALVAAVQDALKDSDKVQSALARLKSKNAPLVPASILKRRSRSRFPQQKLPFSRRGRLSRTR